jgi:hypothetical protein
VIERIWENTDQDKPATAKGEWTSIFFGCQNRHPGILTSGHWECTANLRKRICHGDAAQADSHPTPDNDRWSPRIDAHNKGSRESGPTSQPWLAITFIGEDLITHQVKTLKANPIIPNKLKDRFSSVQS